jgi:low affinity Fe/Cu permease
MSTSVFQNFTNLYSLSKTLKFELKPTEITADNIDFEKDQNRAKHYKNIKVLFDQLHRKFINQALYSFAKDNIDYNEFYRVYNEFLVTRKKRKEDPRSFEYCQKEFDSIKEVLRKKLVSHFDIAGENFKFEINNKLIESDPTRFIRDSKGKVSKGLNDKGLKVMTEAGILEVLKYYVNIDELKVDGLTKEETIEGINFFDKFFTYFGPFNQTRENLYKADGTATAIATRVIDENLVRFCDNIITSQTEIKVSEDIKITPNKLDIEFNKEILEVNSFNQFITQSGIDLYNGGKDGDINIGQFNTNLNEYLQNNYPAKKLRLKELYKIMLTERVAIFEEETEVSCIGILSEVYESNQKYLQPIQDNYQQIWDNKDNEDFLSKVFIKKENLAKLSSEFFGGSNYGILERALKYCGYGKEEKGNVKLDPFIAISSIKESLEKMAQGVDFDIKGKKKTPETSKSSKSIFENSQIELKGYIASDLFKDGWLQENQKDSRELWSIFIGVWQKDFENKVEVNVKYTEAAKQQLIGLEKYQPNELTKYENREIENKLQTQANLAKLFLDSCMNLWQSVKIFEITKKFEKLYQNYSIEEDFYELVTPFADDYQLSRLYDKIRNFSTKKSFSTEKFKINFENATLLAGWDLNKEADNTSIILKNGNRYELIIMDKKANKFFDKAKNPELYQNGDILKMEYKLLPGPNKMLPKVAFADSNRELFSQIFSKYPLIEEIRKLESFKKDPTDKEKLRIINKDHLTIWISFFIDILKTQKDWQNFDWKFQNAQDYPDVSTFYRDVQTQGYKLNFVAINNELLNKAESEGKIFRFQIKNKDWNPKATGSKNLQTIYWEQLFTPENLIKPCLKLNGEGEIFQRPASLKKELKKEGLDSIVHKRFTEDKTFLHIPITLNFSSKEITRYNDYLESNLDLTKINYLGLDRGENNLLYYCLVNSKGEILDQDSLNSIDGSPDYEKLLNAKQESRKDANDKWSVIGNIKELKAGYLSLAVGKIVRLAIENNALIVLENLNYGFKKSRTIKFEKSVYQKFEVALATKLQHVVLKEKQPDELGGVLNGFQLCPPLDVTKLDTASEWGIIKYVGASYTSRICPLTGWHKTRYLRNIKEIKDAFNPDMDNCIKISFDQDLKCYTFDDGFECKGEESLIYAHKDLDRNIYVLSATTFEDRNQIIKGQEIHEKLDEILRQFYNNDEFHQENMIGVLSDRQWKNMAYYFDLVCNIRVKIKTGQKDEFGKDIKIDVIQSPVPYDHNGQKVFFDTRNVDQLQKQLGRVLPIDGDANGAFHIAKKALE